MRFVGKNVVIYGGGASGRAAYELVREKGAKAIVYDDNPSVKQATNSVGVFDGADIIVLSPGVNTQKDFLLDAKLENKLVIGELELASRVCVAEQIAVTGTNGKTTTTLLIDHILKRAGIHSHAVGNVGTPFCCIADKLDESEVAVIEASSFQLENAICFSPDIAVLLNIAPDHLSRHGSMQHYIDAKSNVFKHQGEQDYIVYNADDEVVNSLSEEMVAHKVPFSLNHPLKNGAYISSDFICYCGKPIVHLDDINFCGRELENVLASVCVCMIKNVSTYCISTAISDFSRPKYRRQLVARLDGISIYNDSKATNVHSCLCACDCIGNCVLILGGMQGDENFVDLFSRLPASVKYVCVSGDNADTILQCAKACNYQDIAKFESIDDALDVAFDVCKKMGVENILFSPASKSYDKFNNFEERGAHFDRCVKALRLKR